MDLVRIFAYLQSQEGSLSQGRAEALPPPSQIHLPPSSHDPVCWVEWDPWRPHRKGSLQSHRHSIVSAKQGATGTYLQSPWFLCPTESQEVPVEKTNMQKRQEFNYWELLTSKIYYKLYTSKLWDFISVISFFLNQCLYSWNTVFQQTVVKGTRLAYPGAKLFSLPTDLSKQDKSSLLLTLPVHFIPDLSKCVRGKFLAL